MRNAIASILAAVTLAGIAGCESNAMPNAAALLRYKVDAARDRSWALTREGVVIQSASGSRKVVSLPGWLWVDGPHCPPDIALGPKGEAVITSNVVATLWRIDPETATVSTHVLSLAADNDKDVGFAALAYSAEQATFVAYSEVQRSVWKIDPLLQSAAKIADSDLNRSRQAQRSATARARPCGDLGGRLIDFIGG